MEKNSLVNLPSLARTPGAATDGFRIRDLARVQRANPKVNSPHLARGPHAGRPEASVPASPRGPVRRSVAGRKVDAGTQITLLSPLLHPNYHHGTGSMADKVFDIFIT